MGFIILLGAERCPNCGLVSLIPLKDTNSTAWRRCYSCQIQIPVEFGEIIKGGYHGREGKEARIADGER